MAVQLVTMTSLSLLVASGFWGAQAGSSVSQSGPPSAAELTPETRVFDEVRRSVFVVETESGHGSGFLVNNEGLILTNDHVLGKSRYVAVGIDPAHKYRAAVIVRDAEHDLAVIRVHPEAVAGIAPLRFIDSMGRPVMVGERVVALGSALTDDAAVLTSGIVSRLKADAILADLNVNPGTSGGPLLNLRGEVVGVNTFLVKGAVGPGLAGAVRAHLAEPLLAVAAGGAPAAPPLVRLPVAPPTAYPALQLRSRAASIRNPEVYTAKLRRMRLDVLTPPLIYLLSRLDERRSGQAEPRLGLGADGYVEPSGRGYLWRSDRGGLEAIVGLRVTPETTPGGTVQAVGPETPSSRKAAVRFRKDFRELRLFRNGVEVVPIVPGRFCDTQGGAESRQTIKGCFGFYEYHPEAFAPGARLEVQVYTDDDPTKPIVWRMPPALVSSIWADFEAYFQTPEAKPEG